MSQLHPFTAGGEDDGVVAHNIAAAESVHADFALFTGANNAFTAVTDCGVVVQAAGFRQNLSRRSAVPEGASYFWLWCISTTSMS